MLTNTRDIQETILRNEAIKKLPFWDRQKFRLRELLGYRWGTVVVTNILTIGLGIIVFRLCDNLAEGDKQAGFIN